MTRTGKTAFDRISTIWNSQSPKVPIEKAALFGAAFICVRIGLRNYLPVGFFGGGF